MATEGEFPKIDGDILYASEANKMNPKLIGHVAQFSNFTAAASGTAFTTVGGSVFYSGGESVISDFINVQTSPAMRDSTEGRIYDFRISMSGAGLNNLVSPTKSVNGPDMSFNFNHVFTSGAITASGGNVGSSYIIALQQRTRHGSPIAVNNTWISDLFVFGH